MGGRHGGLYFRAKIQLLATDIAGEPLRRLTIHYENRASITT